MADESKMVGKRLRPDPIYTIGAVDEPETMTVDLSAIVGVGRVYFRSGGKNTETRWPFDIFMKNNIVMEYCLFIHRDDDDEKTIDKKSETTIENHIALIAAWRAFRSNIWSEFNDRLNHGY